jgi:hypothetical protein
MLKRLGPLAACRLLCSSCAIDRSSKGGTNTMKKTTAKRKLVLSAETIKRLTTVPNELLKGVAGGAVQTVTTCPPSKGSIVQ